LRKTGSKRCVEITQLASPVPEPDNNLFLESKGSSILPRLNAIFLYPEAQNPFGCGKKSGGGGDVALGTF